METAVGDGFRRNEVVLGIRNAGATQKIAARYVIESGAQSVIGNFLN
jgi:hypothetical protein